MCNLEELEVVEPTSVTFESSSDSFHLSPDVDKRFRVPGSRDVRIFEVGEHEIEFGAHEEIHAFAEMPAIFPPVFLSQGISFGNRLGFGFGEVEDGPNFLFKKKYFFYRGSFIDIDHLRDKKMFFISPSVHVFKESPFHLPEFFSVESPAVSFQRLSELDQGIFEVLPESLHDMEVVVLKGNVGPDFTDDFRVSSPEIEGNAVGPDTPLIKLSEKFFGHPSAIEPWDGFDIEDSELESISCDLFVSASPSGHILINGEGS
jgi:hypothetical protein